MANWTPLKCKLDEYWWCDEKDLLPGVTLDEIHFYSKVKTRSTVLFITEHDIMKRDGDTVHDAKVTTMFVVFVDGRIGWKHAGKWGCLSNRQFEKWYGETGSKMSLTFSRHRSVLENFLQQTFSDSEWFGPKVEGKYGDSQPEVRFNGILEALSYTWLRMHYPEMSLKNCMFAATLFNRKKKPVFRGLDKTSIVETAIDTMLDTPTKRKLAYELLDFYLMRMERVSRRKDGIVLGDTQTEVTADIVFTAVQDAIDLNNPHATKTLIMNRMAGKDMGLGASLLEYFFKLFPYRSIVQELISPNRPKDASHQIQVAVQDLKKMTKAEKRAIQIMVSDDDETEEWGVSSGPELSTVLAAITNVYEGRTLPRKKQEFINRCARFSFSDEIKKLENDDVRLIHPSELLAPQFAGVFTSSGIGNSIEKACNRIMRQYDVYFTDRGTEQSVVEVMLHGYTLPRIAHARLANYKPVSSEEGLRNTFEQWAKTMNLDSNTSDLRQGVENPFDL